MDSILISEKRSEHLSLLTALLLWVATGPYYFWKLISISPIAYRIFILLLFAILIKKGSRKLETKNRSIPMFLLGVCLYSVLPLLIGNANIYGTLSSLFSLLLLTVIIADSEYLKRVFNKFSKIYAISVAISLLAWVLMLLGFLPFLGIIPNVDGDRFYYHYPFVIIEQLDFATLDEMIRFPGPYDEPGLIGTFSAFILYINKYQLKNKVNLICFLVGLFSLSFFFALSTAFYFLFNYLFSKRIKIKDYMLIILSCLMLGAFYNATKDNDLIYGTFWHRFEYDKDEKKLAGINRTSEGADDFYNKLTISEYLFGGDSGRYKKVVEGSSSYKSVVINNGSIFLFLYLLFFIMYTKKRNPKNSDFILFFALLLGNTFQRPDIYGMVIFFLYICFANSMSRPNTINKGLTIDT